MGGWVDGWTTDQNGWRDGQMDGWINSGFGTWRDGRMDETDRDG